MTDIEMSKATPQGISALRRIEALRYHTLLFDHIAMRPQSGVYDRFIKQWPKVVAAIEGEVYHRIEDLDKFILKDSHGEDEGTARADLWRPVKNLADGMIYHCKPLCPR